MSIADDNFCDLPMVTCPHCESEFQKEDYCDVEAGDEWECPCCGRQIHVIAVDTTINVRLSKEPEDHW